MTKNLHRYVSELFNGKALGPMPVQEFLDTFLPPREDQHSHEANFFADLPQKGSVDKTRLAEKIEQCGNLQAIEVTSPSRVVSSKQCVYGVANHTGASPPSETAFCHRSLDSFLEIKPPGEEYDLGIDDAEEYTDFLNDTDSVRDCFQKIGSYVQDVFSFSYRSHLFTVYLRGTKARLLRWDHSGVIITREFDITTMDFLVVFYHRLSLATRSDKGFDVTVKDVTRLRKEPAYAAARKALKQWYKSNPHLSKPLHDETLLSVGRGIRVRWLVIEVPNTDSHDEEPMQILCRDLHSTTSSLFGRKTRISPGAVLRYPTSTITEGPLPPLSPNEIVLVKDAWQPQSLQKEWEIIRELQKKNVPHIPTVLAGAELTVDRELQRTRSPEYATEDWVRADSESSLPEKKVHRRLVFREIGMPLKNFRRPQNIFRAVRNAVKAHQMAWEAGWLHRDISEGNILLYLKPQSDLSEEGSDVQWGGLLIDWEYACRRDDAEERKKLAGTYQFMSRKLLTVLYICVRYLKTCADADDLSTFMSECFYADWRNDPARTNGNCFRREVLMSGAGFGVKRAYLVITWKHQPPITRWVEQVGDAINILHREQARLRRVERLLNDHPDFDIADVEFLEYTPLDADDLPLIRSKMETRPEDFLLDCDMCSHEWFLRTLQDALDKSQDHVDSTQVAASGGIKDSKRWNRRLEDSANLRGLATERSLDHWAEALRALSLKPKVESEFSGPEVRDQSNATCSTLAPIPHQSDGVDIDQSQMCNDETGDDAHSERPSKRQKLGDDWAA